MKIMKTAAFLTATLSLASAALAGESPKASEQVISVEIQSEPLRVSASAKKPSATLHANTRMSATVAHVNADGTLTLSCESQHTHWPAEQLQVNPR